MSDETTPGPDLCEQIASVIGSTMILRTSPAEVADAVLSRVVQPELDRRAKAADDWAASIALAAGDDLARRDAEIEQLKAAIGRVRYLCDLTIDVSCRVQAIDQARDTLAALDQTEASANVCSRCSNNPVGRTSGLCESCDAEIAAIREFVAGFDPRGEGRG